MADKDFKVKSGLDLGTPLPLTEGGTGQTSASNALNALLPVQTDNTNKVLQTNGTTTSWVTLPNGFQKGDTASRPGSPALGDIYSNTQTGYIEVYTAAGWSQLGVIPLSATIGTATNVATSRAFNNGAASVTFTPAIGGGLASSYTVTSTAGGYSASGSSSPIVVTGLQSSTSYQFTVTATNGYGNSLASTASNAITATTVPQAPTIGSPTIGNRSVSVPFTAGATGGSSITGYTVTSSPGSFTGTGASSPITVSGLTNGTAYTFTVTATNANGTSAASSSSSSVTPLAPVVTGGSLTSDATYFYRTFTANGTLGVTSNNITVDVLRISGGGGAGYGFSGGGGAGGHLLTTSYSLPVANYTVTIGGGGGGGASGQARGTNGTDTSFTGLSSPVGGGAGGAENGNNGALSGGSGGGGLGSNGGVAGTGGAGTSGQGNAGGNGVPSPNTSGGGGGGAGASGGTAVNLRPGVGGNGTNSYSSWASATGTGESGYYAGGGGGGGFYTNTGFQTEGGLGGGGYSRSAMNDRTTVHVEGLANMGAGGGGGSQGVTNSVGGSGGSGIVIVRYLKTAV